MTDGCRRSVEKACLRPGLNRGRSVYKTDVLPLSHTGVILTTTAITSTNMVTNTLTSATG